MTGGTRPRVRTGRGAVVIAIGAVLGMSLGSCANPNADRLEAGAPASPALADPGLTTSSVRSTSAVVTTSTSTSTSTSTTAVASTSTVATAPPVPATVPVSATEGTTRRAPGPNEAPPLTRPWAASFPVAHAERSPLEVYDEPGGAVLRTFTDPTSEGLPFVALVRSRSSDGNWLHLQLPGRPNGSMGWVRRVDVSLTSVPRHIVVRLSTNRMVVYRGEQVELELPVSVGAPQSPTPTGTFYIDGLHQTLGAVDGDYGAFQLSFTGYSTVYQHFAGGIGQAAFHGTNRPDLIGRPASHGCVRLSNPDVLRLARLIPLGTPVEIVP